MLFFINLSKFYGQDYGAKAGITMSSLKGMPGTNFRPGFQIGGFKEFGGEERLFFKTEALLSQKGSWSWNNTNFNNVSLAYFEVSLMFGIDIIDGFSLNFGIQPTMFLVGRHRFLENEEKYSNLLYNNISRFDYSTLIGAEYFIKENIFLGLRYNHSFVPIQGYDGNINTGVLLVSRTFQIYCGYRLRVD